MVLAAVAIAVALIFTRPVMVPFVLAIFVSYLVAPMVDTLQSKARVPRVLSVLIALVVVAGIMTTLGLLITMSARSMISNAELYSERLVDLAEKVFALGARFGVDFGGELGNSRETILEGIRSLPLVNMVGRAAGTVVGLVTNSFLVMIFVIYLLMGRHPQTLRSSMHSEIDAKIRRYLVMKVIISATTGTVVWITLAIFGLDLALVFGVLAFFLNFIPSIGSVIATLLPLPVALIQFDSMLPVVGIFLIPGAVQITVGNVVEPLVMGEGLDLHPVTILMALIFWGLIWGIVGMLLAAPMTAVLKIVFDRLETTKPLAELLAGRLPVVPSTEDHALSS